MKQLIVICCFVALAYSKSFELDPEAFGEHRCVNMWDEGCINGQLPGAGNDDYYLNGNFNPGKRCINMWDDGCANGQLPGAGDDDYYLGGGFNPGKRSLVEFLKKFHKTKPAL